MALGNSWSQGLAAYWPKPNSFWYNDISHSELVVDESKFKSKFWIISVSVKDDGKFGSLVYPLWTDQFQKSSKDIWSSCSEKPLVFQLERIKL